MRIAYITRCALCGVPIKDDEEHARHFKEVHWKNRHTLLTVDTVVLPDIEKEDEPEPAPKKRGRKKKAVEEVEETEPEEEPKEDIIDDDPDDLSLD